MADCSQTKVFLAEWKRMCDYYKEGLAEGCCRRKDCPVSDRDTHFCDPYIGHIKQKHIDAVQKWSDEHPEPKPKTYADVFFEKFPNAEKGSDGAPAICRAKIFSDGTCYMKPLYCHLCWNEPYPEQEAIT